MTPCPSAERLAAYREGRTALPDVEAHLNACPECRDVLRAFPQGDPDPLPASLMEGLRAMRPGRRVLWPAAAAALLLAAGLAAWRMQGGRPPSPATPPPPASVELDLVASPGSRFETLPGLRLASGTLWLETASPLTVGIPGGTLDIESGRWVLEAPRKELAWIAAAEAAERKPAIRIWALEGRGRLQGDRLEGPVRADLGEDGTLSRTPLQAPEAEALERRRLEALLALPEIPREGPPPASFRWVTAFAGREGSAEAELVFPVGGTWRRWVAGLAGERPRASETVEVRWDGARLRARVGGRRVLDLDAARAASLLPEADRPGWAVSVRGGRATLAQSRVLR